jgi:short-subunit dehydrogenase
MSKFTGRTIVITGASEGIGRALACELAPDRPNLVLAARNPQRLEDAALACRALGAEVLAVPTDVAEEQACRALIARAVERFGGLDVLVNNAGITMWSRFDAVENLSAFEHIMRVNYLSGVYATAAALPHLKKSRGLIVAVASMAGLTGVPERTGYAASKHAQVGFFESLRIELEGSGVDVTLIAPDFVVSQIHRRALGADGKPLGASPMVEPRIMTSEQCARLIRGAMQRRQRLLVTSLRGKLGRVVKAFAPGLIDRIAARAIRMKH